MLTEEGADDAEIIVRPSGDGGWRVEIPRERSIFVTVVSDRDEALRFARQLCPNAQIRLLPTEESAEASRGDLS